MRRAALCHWGFSLSLPNLYSRPGMQFSWVLRDQFYICVICLHASSQRLAAALLMKTQSEGEMVFRCIHFHCRRQSNLRTKPVVDLIVTIMSCVHARHAGNAAACEANWGLIAFSWFCATLRSVSSNSLAFCGESRLFLCLYLLF